MTHERGQVWFMVRGAWLMRELGRLNNFVSFQNPIRIRSRCGEGRPITAPAKTSF